MLQINILKKSNQDELMAAINEFLATIEDDEAVKAISVNEETWTAIIQYKVVKKNLH